jgi:predicted dehydrogenase
VRRTAWFRRQGRIDVPATAPGSDSAGVVRFGILGAARIAPAALIKPARANPEAVVRSVAARDPARAATFAAKHRIGFVRGDYDHLLSDPDVDAIYNPLPNALHAEWTMRALEAGKHVLCEKPFASNAAEAAHVAEAARRCGRVVMEAFHYRYHPVANRLVEICTSGELGMLERVETWICFPLPRFSDIRYSYALGGGAQMDAGCYAVHLARLLGGGEPTVTSARAQLHSPDVDRAMRAELRFGAGHTGRVTSSMWSRSLLRIGARVTGSDGELHVLNPLAPQLYHRISVRSRAGSRVEHLARRSTYDYQLDAFCAAVLRQAPYPTTPDDAVANMAVIDAVYEAAGMRRRGAA